MSLFDRGQQRDRIPLGIHRIAGDDGQPVLGIVYGHRTGGGMDFVPLNAALAREGLYSWQSPLARVGRTELTALQQAMDDVMRGRPITDFPDFNSASTQTNLRRSLQEQRLGSAQLQTLRLG